MNQLLTGGRPVLALAKDCCYKDISSLAEDIQRLQAQKSQIEAKYEQAIKGQETILHENDRLKEQNEKLAKELNDIKDLALSVESEANVSLDALYKRNTALKLKLNEAKKRIHDLETQIGSIEGAGTKDIKTANMQIHFLQQQLQALTDKGKKQQVLFFLEKSFHIKKKIKN